MPKLKPSFSAIFIRVKPITITLINDMKAYSESTIQQRKALLFVH